MQGTGKRRWKWWVGGVLAGAAGLGVFGSGLLQHRGAAAVPPQEKKTIRPAVPVTVEPVTARPLRRAVNLVGTLFGQEEVPITTKVEGRVRQLYHDLGDRVKPGEPLLELDSIDHQLAANEAQRSLELELARLGLKELPGPDFSVQSLPSVARAAAQERNAAARRERAARLGRGSATSEEDREAADKDYAVAQADYKQMLLEASATLAAARMRAAALDSALQRLKDTRIVAPAPSLPGSVEYVVSQRSVTEGEMVRTMNASTLFKLIIDSPLKLLATVPERHRAAIKVGQEVELQVEAYPHEKFHGKVARVNPAIDRASRTFQIEIRVPNEDRRLSAGSFVRLAVLTHIDSAARTIPEEAVVRFAGVTRVFVVREEKVVSVPIRIGMTLEVPGVNGPRSWIEVEGELKPEMLVVTSGQSQLTDGTPVRIRTPGEGAAP